MWEGLLFQHIHRRPGDFAIHQRVIQRPLIHHWAPGHVDEHCGGLHLLKGFRIHEIPGKGAQGTMEGNHVALPEQGFFVHLRERHLFFPSGQRMVYHPAAQRFRDVRHPAADIAHAHDSPGFSVQLVKRNVEIGKTVLSAVRA